MQVTNMRECLKNNLIVYRNMLTIPRKVKFGIELELEDVQYDEINRLVTKQFGSSWKVKEDRSLKKDCNAEIVSPPLCNEKQTWISLKKISKIIRPCETNL